MLRLTYESALTFRALGASPLSARYRIAMGLWSLSRQWRDRTIPRRLALAHINALDTIGTNPDLHLYREETGSSSCR